MGNAGWEGRKCTLSCSSPLPTGALHWGCREDEEGVGKQILLCPGKANGATPMPCSQSSPVLLGAWGTGKTKEMLQPNSNTNSEAFLPTPLWDAVLLTSSLSFSCHHFCCFYASEAVNKPETRGPLCIGLAQCLFSFQLQRLVSPGFRRGQTQTFPALAPGRC